MNLIMINAKQGGGKTSLSNALLKKSPNSINLKFAQPLYDILKIVKNYYAGRYYDSEFDINNELDSLDLIYEIKKYIYDNGIKSKNLGIYFVGDELHYSYLKHDRILYSELVRWYDATPGFAFDKISDADGKLLQYLGTEFGRVSIDENIWVNIFDCKYRELSKKYNIILNDDCRFENEFDSQPNGYKIRLDCPEEERKARAEKWRDNVNHPSEIGLDEYAKQGKFNKYYNTSTVNGRSIETIVDNIISELRIG